ncbi:MAG: hypothetical protein E4H01_03895 [Lysobacterales bacterium]|nr:MAG: hypothetical protein E4H01_03895 [Xanthomonadales bacterium]
MAVTISFFKNTAKLFAEGTVDETKLPVMLTLGYTYAATHSAISQVSGTEVSVNGWTVGGHTIAAGAITNTGDTTVATLDGTDLAVTAVGGSIGPADGAVIYDFTGSLPLFYIAFGQTETAGVGTAFAINWNASGIATWTPV